MTDTTASSFVGCEICIESFLDDTEKNICAIPCGHVFHESCLTRWFQSQCESRLRINCPKCRKFTTFRQMIRLFLFGASPTTEHAPAPAMNQPNSDNSTNTSSDYVGANGLAHSNEEFDFSDFETISTTSFGDEDDDEDLAGFDGDIALGSNTSGFDAPNINDDSNYDSDETSDVAMNAFAAQGHDDYADLDEL